MGNIKSRKISEDESSFIEISDDENESEDKKIYKNEFLKVFETCIHLKQNLNISINTIKSNDWWLDAVAKETELDKKKVIHTINIMKNYSFSTILKQISTRKKLLGEKNLEDIVEQIFAHDDYYNKICNDNDSSIIGDIEVA